MGVLGHQGACYFSYIQSAVPEEWDVTFILLGLPTVSNMQNKNEMDKTTEIVKRSVGCWGLGETGDE